MVKVGLDVEVARALRSATLGPVTSSVLVAVAERHQRRSKGSKALKADIYRDTGDVLRALTCWEDERADDAAERSDGVEHTKGDGTLTLRRVIARNPGQLEGDGRERWRSYADDAKVARLEGRRCLAGSVETEEDVPTPYTNAVRQAEWDTTALKAVGECGDENCYGQGRWRKGAR